MVMVDYSAENVIHIRKWHEELLSIMTPRLPEFMAWLWPEGERKLDRFHPVPGNQTYVLIEGSRAGAAFDASGNSLGSAIDLMRLLDFKEPPGDLYREFQRTLGPSVPRDKADDLGEFINSAVDYAGKPVKRQEWIVDEWLPVGCVTSLYGGAGFGKSLVSLQVADAVGTGRPFFGLQTRQGTVMVIACEENFDQLHARQIDVLASMGVPLDYTGNVWLKPRYGHDNMMAFTGPDGRLQFTPFFHQVHEAARKMRPALLVIDNIAQVFGGNENSRPEVTQFVNALNRIAVELNCAVLLLGHPGKATDSEYSGSTAWDAAVRSRWTLTRPKTDKVDEIDDLAADPSKMRVLRKSKANYASTGDEIKLIWDKGAFVLNTPELMDTVDRIEAGVREREEDRRFLDGLARAVEQGMEPTASPTSLYYAPKLLRQHCPECKGMSLQTLQKSMRRLWDAREVVPGYGAGSPSRRKTILVPRGHPAAVPGCNRGEDSDSPSNYHQYPFKLLQTPSNSPS